MVWLTREQLIANMKSIADQNPALCSYASTGKTVNNNDIWLFRIGNNPAKTLIDGTTHGMENPGGHCVMYLMQWLLGGSAEANYVLSRMQILLVPIVNYDKYQQNGVGNPIYRKNNRPDPTIGVGCPVTTDPPRCNGVDINRNHVRGWSGVADTLSPYYSGPSAGSEPETQAINVLLNSEAPKVYINIHDWGGLSWLYVAYDGLSSAANILLDNYATKLPGGFTAHTRISTSSPGGQCKDDGCRYGQTVSFNWEETGPADGSVTSDLIATNKAVHLRSMVIAAAEIYGSITPTQRYFFTHWQDTGLNDNPRTIAT